MKKLIILIFLVNSISFLSAQQNYEDSVLTQLSKAKDDSTRVNLLNSLSAYYFLSNPDTAFVIAQQGLRLAQSIGYKKGEMTSDLDLAFSSWAMADYPTAIKLGSRALDHFNATKDTEMTLNAYQVMLRSYRDQGDYNESLQLGRKALTLSKSTPDCLACGADYADIGSIYFGIQRYDSALFYLKLSITYSDAINFYGGWISFMIGKTMAKLNNDSAAFVYYKKGIDILSLQNNLKDLAGAYNSLATLFINRFQNDSAIYYAQKALDIAKQKKFNQEKSEAYLILSEAYEKTDTKEALQYYKLAMAAKDSLFNQDKQRQIASFKFNEEIRRNEIKSAQMQYKNRNRLYILSGLLALFLAVMIFLFRLNRQRQKAKTKIEKAYSELKATQAQLIQSEKMASLGELTAGIAHEIQNPLNFVNNFSEVNKEMLEELKAERLKPKGERDEQTETDIINDVIENSEKINHHGKRAGDIVKGMLQHSRSGTGVKEPTDINALCDEYLRLSYHGLRAKDKSFNAIMKTDFDKSIGQVNIIPQEIGRVLLNLFNNAFYACTERSRSAVNEQINQNLISNSKEVTPFEKVSPLYEPTVSVTTKKSGNSVLITVSDNGNGIPQKIVDKIFQPFFTTKPTGQGTGLGLSLSYDIVKAHGGEIKVESQERKGTEFIIQLPVS
ncbi:MAG: ATP-binding protein [Ginsengibacter sp.]